MKKFGCFGVALFLAFCLSMLANLVLGSLLASKKGTPHPKNLQTASGVDYDEEILQEGGPQKVVVIPLDGIIAYSQEGPGGFSMVEEIKVALEQAESDEDVVAVVLSVDSPGGEITASDVLYEAVKRFSEKKPTVVFINSIGASGAYYTACGANWIMCNPTSFTGSIGVIISTLNYQELFGKVGLQSIVFKSGKFKDMLDGSRKISPEESEYVQGMIMQSYDRFLGIVAKSRRLDPAALRAGPADGRILSGEDALAAKLVDEVGYIESSYSKAMELAGVENATVVRYQPTFNFSSLFRLFGAQASQHRKTEVSLFPAPIRLESGRFYLLPTIFAP